MDGSETRRLNNSKEEEEGCKPSFGTPTTTPASAFAHIPWRKPRVCAIAASLPGNSYLVTPPESAVKKKKKKKSPQIVT
jgi:hypothetical protein